MKIEHRSSSARQEKSCKSAEPHTSGQVKPSYGKFAVEDSREAKAALYKQIGQGKSNGGHQQNSTVLPASTTRAIDPDRLFYNGFLLENPVNRGEGKRPICSFDSSSDQRAENLDQFWNFTGGKTGKSQQGSAHAQPHGGSDSNGHTNASANSSDKGSDGSINNIQRVYQKARNNRAMSGKKKEHSLIGRDHSLVRGEHRHSDDKLARDLVPIGRGRDGPANMQHGGLQQNLRARALPLRRRDPLHIVHGFYCQWCLFESQPCPPCNGQMCAALKLPNPQEQGSIRSGQGGVKQTRSEASAPSKFQLKPEPLHIKQGNYCASCIFEDYACEECQEKYPACRIGGSRLAARLNAIEQKTEVGTRNARSAGANAGKGGKQSGGVGQHGITLKKPAPQSPAHIHLGFYCQECLFERDPCNSCYRDIFGNGSDEVKKAFILGRQQDSMASYAPASRGQQVIQGKTAGGQSETQWRRPLSAWRSQKTQSSGGEKPEGTSTGYYGAQVQQGGNQNSTQQSWIRPASAQQPGGLNGPISFRSAYVSTCNPQPKSQTGHGGKRSKRQRHKNQASQSDTGSSGEHESKGYRSEEYAVDHSGVMRPNKTYTGRTKQHHWDAKSKWQHC